MKKANLVGIGIVMAVMVLPEVALAKTASYGYAKQILDSAWEFFSDYLMPQTSSTLATVLSCAGVVLSMVWMLGIPKVRKTIARIGMPIIVVAAAIILWDIVPTWANVLIVILFIFSLKEIFAAIKNAFLHPVATAKGALAEKGDSWFFAIVGALWFAGLINSSLLTNKNSAYMPGILSALAGLGFIGWMIFEKRIKQRFANRGKQPATPHSPNRSSAPELQLCPKCETPNRPGYRFCKECGKPPTTTIQTSTDEDFDFPDTAGIDLLNR